MEKIIFIFVFLLGFNLVVAQPYTDYLGAGHNTGFTVTSSSSVGLSTPEKTLDGSGMEAKLFDASRFLAQSTFGANIDLIEDLRDLNNYETWIDQQFDIPASLMMPKVEDVWQQVLDESNDPDNEFGPYSVHFNYAWWELNMTNEDLLRQRVAYALSQLLVVSINSDLRDWAEALGSYYDILINRSFGNYRDLLMDVTLHPSMGYYLSHLNNPREIIEDNIRPDENYAREIMQLFSIGLYMLNPDGTWALDGDGNPIPTYDNNDIRELAKIFTGLGGGDLEDWVWWKTDVEFGDNIYMIDKTVPMQMFEAFHQPGAKTFIGQTIPAGQTGIQDIEDAIDILFNHQNTGPFVAYRLIQRLVKSNPTPAYVGRIAEAFADNGNGVRGDMKAVIKAILLDEEARSAEAMADPTHGKLREPMLKYTHIAKTLPTYRSRNRYWNNGFNYLNSTRQHVLASPTVFNFYLPDYQPVGDITALGLVAPEFKLLNTTSSVSYINEVRGWTGGVWEDQGILNEWGTLMYSWHGTQQNPDYVRLIFSEIEANSTDSELIINELDKRLTHGQLTDETRGIIRNSLNRLYWTWGETEAWRYERVRAAVYLFMISPDYNILK